MEIVLGGKEYAQVCVSIASSLPEYFNANGMSRLKHDLLDNSFYVALCSGNVVGFAVLNTKNSQIVEVSWMAVSKDRQGIGIGSSMLSRITRNCKHRDAKLLEVKTLSKNIKYLPYEATRKFYEKNGFIALEVGIRYPGWDEGNLCDIYVKLI